MSNSTHALIIDDEAFNLEVIGRLLESQGVQTTPIQDIRVLEENILTHPHIDLVFLDLEMPQMDGYQVFSWLRAALGNQIPIVACTVHANEISTVRDLGFHSFIAKPLDPKRFPEQVKIIMNGGQVWDF